MSIAVIKLTLQRYNTTSWVDQDSTWRDTRMDTTARRIQLFEWYSNQDIDKKWKF